MTKSDFFDPSVLLFLSECASRVTNDFSAPLYCSTDEISGIMCVLASIFRAECMPRLFYLLVI